MRSPPAPTGISSTPPPYSKTFPDETVAYFSDISDGVDGPILVYNWPHGSSVEIDPALASRIADIENVVAIKDSTPNAQQFYETVRTVVDRIRVFGPFMSSEGFEQLLAHGGDGFIGGGTLFGAPDAEFWEAYWRGDHELCRAHAVRTDRLFPKLWLPGGWGGQLRRLPEPAQGDHEDARPARRRGAPAATARDRPREPARRSGRS